MQVRHKRHQHMMRKQKGGSVGMPSLVSGNPKVVAAAKEKKSIGEVPGIYSKGRLDRKPRG